VETFNGMDGKKAHSCHLHFLNTLHSTGELYDLDNLVRKESTAACTAFYAILTAQTDADSNQQTASLESSTLYIAPHVS
jgi:hypothetical protein